VDYKRFLSFYRLNITSIPPLTSIDNSIYGIDLRGTQITDINLDIKINHVLAVNCPSLKTITRLPESCKSLNTSFCHNLNYIHYLPSSLKRIRLEECRSLKSLPLLPKNLEEIYVFGCESLTIIPYRNANDPEPTMPKNLVIYAITLRTLVVPFANEFIYDTQKYLRLWEEWHRNNESINRILNRNKIIKEDLIKEVWHPRRVEKLLEIGGFELLDSY
jgi:hypothetical protein